MCVCVCVCVCARARAHVSVCVMKQLTPLIRLWHLNKQYCVFAPIQLTVVIVVRFVCDWSSRLDCEGA